MPSDSGSCQISGIKERIGKELLPWQPTLFGKVTLGRLDHYWRTTGINLVFGQVGKVLHDSAMDKARATVPATRWRSV